MCVAALFYSHELSVKKKSLLKWLNVNKHLLSMKNWYKNTKYENNRRYHRWDRRNPWVFYPLYIQLSTVESSVMNREPKGSVDARKAVKFLLLIIRTLGLRIQWTHPSGSGYRWALHWHWEDLAGIHPVKINHILNNMLEM